MANYVYIATSIDGFIADENGGLDWLNSVPNPDGSDFGFAEFINSIDAIVMGRRTYETVLQFDGHWPYSKKVFVLSSTFKSVPLDLQDKVEVIKGTPGDITNQLNGLGYHNLYIDGGMTIQGFLAEGLIDEMIITRVSVLLGRGIPLFGESVPPTAFYALDSRKLTDNLVQTRYKRHDAKV